jgi:opacity protein-like surface antigen
MKMKLLAAAAIVAMSAPAFAADADVHVRHHHHYAHGVDEIYLHNYGPPDFYPGTIVPPDRVVYPVNGAPYGIYDGFSRLCAQSSANYRGQDGRRHPCN